NGCISHAGLPEVVVQLYLTETRKHGVVELNAKHRQHYIGTGDARITSLYFNKPAPLFKFGEPIVYNLAIRAERQVQRIRVNMTIYARDGSLIGSAIGHEISGLASGEQRVMTVTLPPTRLSPGFYQFGISIGRGDNFTGLTDYDVIPTALEFEVEPEAD